MIIFGYKTFKRKKGLTKETVHCEKCGVDSKWKLLNLWNWFTLFFVPIFPFYKKTVLVCSSCECGIKVNKKNKENIMKQIEDNATLVE